MTTRRICAFIFLGVGLLQAQSVWVVDSLQRVHPKDSAGATTSIALYAGKGEYESFQVIVHAAGSSLTITNLAASNLTGPGGATIPQQNFTFYREYYVNVTAPSPNFGGANQPLGAGWYPDALIPFKDPSTGLVLSGGMYQAVPFTLAANYNQPFWIDINVPRTAVAGNYSGTVTVSTSLGTFTIPVTLQVWNFTLPVAPRLKASFGYHTTWGNLANNEVMLQNRVGTFIIPANQVSALKPYGAEITGLPFFNKYSGCTIESPPSVSTLSAAVAQFAGFPTYVYPADEVSGCPNLALNLQLWAQVARASGTKTLVTVIPQAALLDDGTGTGHTDVDIWTILPKQYAAALPELPTIFAKGNELWSYTALVQETYSPKWELDFAPINYRIFPGFINQQFGFTGMLYSDVNRWTSDPWNNVNTFQVSTYNYPCEGLLVYPGQQVGMSSTSVVPSMRLKFLRDGFDDYDYIALLKDQGDSAFADSIVNSIAPDWTNWTKSTAALQAARIQLGQELDKLGGSALQSPSNPSPANGTTNAATSLTLQWTSVSGATQYQVYFGTAANPPLLGTVTSPSWPVSNLSTATKYNWKVVAVGGGTSVSGPVWSFTTGTTSQPPSNPSPATGATNAATSLTLQWSSVSGATQYQVYFGTAANPPLISTITSPSLPVSNLSTATKYYWKIVAIVGGTSISGPIWSFTTVSGTPLQPPTTPWPATGSLSPDTSLTLQCSAVLGATQYQIYFGTSATSLALYSTVSATGSAVRTPVYNLSAATTYYWKVVAIAGGTSASGSVWSFTTPSAALQPPTNPWPVSGTASPDTSLTLQCSAVAGATQYQVYFGTSATSLALYRTVTATGSVVRAPVYKLSSGTTYYWKVVATNGVVSTSGPVWSFNTP